MQHTVFGPAQPPTVHCSGNEETASAASFNPDEVAGKAGHEL